MSFIHLIVLLFLVYIGSIHVSNLARRRRLHKLALERNATCAPYVKAKLPFSIELVWCLISAARRNESHLDVVAEQFAEYGPTFEASGILSGSILYTIDPLNIQAMLATQFTDYGLGAQRNRRLLMGKCIFTEEGAFWAHSRAIFKPQFARSQINNLDMTEKAVQELFRALHRKGVSRGDNKVEVDIMPLLYNFTMDTSTEFLFGESTKTQTSQGKLTKAAAALKAQFGDAFTFDEAVEESQRWLTTRIRYGGLHWILPQKRGRAAIAFVRQYGKYCVESAIEAAASGKPKGNNYSLLEALVESAQDSPEILRDQLLGLLLAGRDTTACLLSWTLLLLAQNPTIFAKTRTAILQHFGPYTENENTKPEKLTFETLKSCQYLQYVLRESLRMYDVSPANVRFANHDTTLPRGGGPGGQQPIVVPKGKPIVFVPHLVHRRKDIWGPDADEFLPERWFGRKIDWDFIPFSGGPRACMGQQYALTEAGYFIVRMLQRFDKMEWIGPPGEPRKNVTFTMSPKDGVPLRLTYANF